MEEHIRKKTGPIVIQIPWIDEDMWGIGSNIYMGSHPSKFKKATMHAMLIIGFGYDKVEGKKIRFWLIQNSFGHSWGVMGVDKFSQNCKDGNGEPLINKSLFTGANPSFINGSPFPSLQF
ncbi:cathepsin B [Trifolium repens]|nr:cathepsin B [Trifolium repens]